MPHVTDLPPGSRFFARLDRFECECPSCGQLLTPLTGAAGLPDSLKAGGGRLRSLARQHKPSLRTLSKLTWNPYTQRLRCPYCDHRFIAGLILWSLPPSLHSPTTPPPDAVPDRRQMLELRSINRGWWAFDKYLREQAANLATACSCPDRGTSKTCSVHGWPELRESPTGAAEGAKPAPVGSPSIAESETRPGIGGKSELIEVKSSQ